MYEPPNTNRSEGERDMATEKGKVCVTGGTGFIGSWLILRLLDHGYSVTTTVRFNPAEHKKEISFLTNLPGASERLQIFHSDLNNPKSFEAAIEGCTGVFHVATPVDFEVREPEEIVTKRSINGALGILNACLNSKRVKRVVYTSSASTVQFASNKDEDEVDESFWTDVDYIKALKPFGWSYAISKTLTEKAVLEFSEKNGLEVVTLIPSFVIGPFICPKLPGSVKITLALILGNEDEYSLLLNTSMVHVDDVAKAHIFLLEHPDVKGRYNCSSDSMTLESMAELLSSKYPEFHIPSKDSLKEIKGYKIPSISSKKLKDCGFKYEYGVEEIFHDAVQCCREKGYL